MLEKGPPGVRGLAGIHLDVNEVVEIALKNIKSGFSTFLKNPIFLKIS